MNEINSLLDKKNEFQIVKPNLDINLKDKKQILSILTPMELIQIICESKKINGEEKAFLIHFFNWSIENFNYSTLSKMYNLEKRKVKYILNCLKNKQIIDIIKVDNHKKIKTLRLNLNKLNDNLSGLICPKLQKSGTFSDPDKAGWDKSGTFFDPDKAGRDKSGTFFDPDKAGRDKSGIVNIEDSENTLQKNDAEIVKNAQILGEKGHKKEITYIRNIFLVFNKLNKRNIYNNIISEGPNKLVPSFLENEKNEKALIDPFDDLNDFEFKSGNKTHSSCLSGLNKENEVDEQVKQDSEIKLNNKISEIKKVINEKTRLENEEKLTNKQVSPRAELLDENQASQNKDKINKNLSGASAKVSLSIANMRNAFEEKDLILVDSLLDNQKLLRKSTKIAKTVEEQWTSVLYDSYMGKIKHDRKENEIDKESWRDSVITFIDKTTDSNIRNTNYLIKILISKSEKATRFKNCPNKKSGSSPMMHGIDSQGRDTGYTTREEHERIAKQLHANMDSQEIVIMEDYWS